MDEAIKRTPGTIAKQHGGQPTKRQRKGFSVYTVSRLMEEFRDPRAILLEIASTDTHALAAEMQCSLMNALAERRLAAMAVLPYCASKMPVSVDVRNQKIVHLNIVSPEEFEALTAVAAATDEEQADGSFSMQLLTTDQPVEAKTTEPQPPAADTAALPDRLAPAVAFFDSTGPQTTPIDAQPDAMKLAYAAKNAAPKNDRTIVRRESVDADSSKIVSGRVPVTPSVAATIGETRTAGSSWQPDDRGGTWTPASEWWDSVNRKGKL